MKIILALAGLLAVGLASDEAVSKERQARQFFINPSSNDFVDYDKNPLLPYMLNVNNPLFRQLIRPPRPSLSRSASTTVIVQTSTAVLTCTLSTTACESRRRRHVLSDLLEQQQSESIQPSPVNKIEATASPMGDSIRERREADPQLFAAARHPSYFSQLSPSIANSPNDRQSLPPSLNNAFNILSQFMPPIVANNNPILALAALLNGNFPTIWMPGVSSSSSPTNSVVTSTSCVYVVSTSTSTPSCSQPGTLPQCAAERIE